MVRGQRVNLCRPLQLSIAKSMALKSVCVYVGVASGFTGTRETQTTTASGFPGTHEAQTTRHPAGTSPSEYTCKIHIHTSSQWGPIPPWEMQRNPKSRFQSAHHYRWCMLGPIQLLQFRSADLTRAGFLPLHYRSLRFRSSHCCQCSLAPIQVLQVAPIHCQPL